jgi:crotonobetainyl-CoA:carnitine CoA-transferase CaiB-like acyl-CoA transferase
VRTSATQPGSFAKGHAVSAPGETDCRPGPLAGITIVDLSSTLPGAQASQFLADCGADVILVEPPGGSPLREIAGWPGLLRGKRSVELDLHDDSDVQSLRGLLRGADVMINTMRPSTMARMGLTPDVLAGRYPRLISAAITGWGSSGPWQGYKGYEALIMAKTGVMFEKRQLTDRPGPAFTSSPYASFGAAQAAVQGIIAALIERLTSGRGQVVETSLVLGLGAMDPYNWFYEQVLHKYPDAFAPMDRSFDDEDRPVAYLVYALLAAPTKDGRWLQFAQVAPRLIQAWLTELDLLKELAKPKWQGFPVLPTAQLRQEFWEIMLEKVADRTLAEWQQVFDTNPDISAELFRTPDNALEHPQILHDGRVVTVDDPVLGPVRQPATMILSRGRPLTPLRPAPQPGQHTAEVLAAPAADVQSAGRDAPSSLPLDGVTIVEFGTMFAGPYGATLLTDLGARVIKIEPLDGDNIRTLVAFPEAGGAKVLQGKESVAIDISKPEGLALVHEIVKRGDVVLECFRGGTAARAGIDEATLKRINPELVYLSSPGYGIDGPYSGRPAYAPSIGASSGLAMTDSRGAAVPPSDDADRRRKAVMLFAAGTVPAVQADGVAALGVGSALLVGLYAKRLGIEIPGMVTTMMGTATQAMIAYNTSYRGRPDIPVADPEFYGLGALYRLYQASDGWIFLAAPLEKEWLALSKALSQWGDLGSDDRFVTASARSDNDAALSAALSGIFAARPKQVWEDDLTRADVGCVTVTEEAPEWHMQDDDFFAAGYAVEADSPIFGEHRRLAPLQKFSRSPTKADAGCTVGQHTGAVLREIGVSDDRIADLSDRGVIGL